MTPLACTIAFVALSGFQVGAIVVMTCAALLLAYLLGREEGRETATRKLFEQARDNGVDPRWLASAPLDDGSDVE